MRHNESILSALLTAESEGRLHHAYILSGPASAAKTECVERFAARIFSRSGGLFAAAAPSEEHVLERIRARNHPDFTRIETLEGGVGVDETRELPRLLAFSPLEAGRRIVLVPDAASLTSQAANSILKVLEEPPAHTMFFLLCRDPADLLRTIVSRCQVLRFAPLSSEEMLRFLGERLPAKDSEALLAWSEGSLERAELLLADEQALAIRQEAAALLLDLWESSPRVPSAAVRWVERVESALHTQVVLDTWETVIRDFAFVTNGAKAAQLRFGDLYARLAALAAKGGELAAEEVSQRSSAIHRFRVYRLLNGNLRLDFAALLGELQIFSVGKGASASVK